MTGLLVYKQTLNGGWMELKSDSIEANASTPGLSPHAGIPSTIVTAALSLSLFTRVAGMEKATLCSLGASFSASQPSALICLSDACSTMLRLCSEQRKHRAAAFLLKKPFNLGFKALPGRQFNLRDLWFPMLGVCILSVGFSIPSLRVTTREYCRHNQRIPPREPPQIP